MMISHAPENYRCPFCALQDRAKKDKTLSAFSDIVYQDDRVMAFLAAHQWKGNVPNVLVIPKVHFENVYDLPVEYGNDIQRVVKVVSFALKTVFDCDGVSTRQHNGRAGSQEVWHYHTHVTPRFKKDRFYLRYSLFRRFMPDAERAVYAEKLRIGVEIELARGVI